MRYQMAALVVMAALVGMSQAQPPTSTPTPFATSNAPCGSGLPCGPVPWPMPRYPVLSSPTPLPVVGSTGLTIPHATYPAPDIGDAQGQAANAGELLATAQAVGTVAVGTPMDIETELSTLTGNASTFIAYAKAVPLLNFGPFTPLIVLMFTAFLLIIIYKMTTFMLPVLGVVVGITRKLVQLFLDFLPF